MNVAIVGVGLHPFGRFADRTGIDMGAIAIRRALADAGVERRDIQFAFAGSYEIDNPDAVVALLGLTGIPFTKVPLWLSRSVTIVWPSCISITQCCRDMVTSRMGMRFDGSRPIDNAPSASRNTWLLRGPEIATIRGSIPAPGK